MRSCPRESESENRMRSCPRESESKTGCAVQENLNQKTGCAVQENLNQKTGCAVIKENLNQGIKENPNQRREISKRINRIELKIEPPSTSGLALHLG
jgi:hypothetical protein